MDRWGGGWRYGVCSCLKSILKAQGLQAFSGIDEAWRGHVICSSFLLFVAYLFGEQRNLEKHVTNTSQSVLLFCASPVVEA